MSEIAHQPCPFVGCDSSDAFSYNTDGFGKCHSCNRKYPSRNSTHEWAKEMYPVKETQEQSSYKEPVRTTFEGIRGLDEDIAKLYSIQRQYFEDGSYREAFKYPNNVKYRNDAPAGSKEKKFWTKQKGALLDLFGPSFNAGSSNRLYLTEGECFLPETEVLTPTGWVQLKDFSLYKDKVLQVGPNGEGTFTYAMSVIDKKYEGDLIEYRSNSYYSITTEEHNLVRVTKRGDFKKYPATKRIDLRVPRVVSSFKGSGTKYSFEELQAWIMLSADFTFRESGDIDASFKKDRKVVRAKTILDSLGVRYSSKVEKRGNTNIYIHRGHRLGFAQKDLPWDLLHHPQRHLLLAELVLWDGNKVKTRNQSDFSTNRKHNADVVQALAHSCGYTSTIIHRKNEYGSWMRVSILYGKKTSTTQGGFSRVPYSGRVMCLTVPAGMLLVRQKDSVSVSGNCDAASLYQALGKSFPVKSLPSSSISKKFLQHNNDYLSSFKELVYAGELDDAGRRAADLLYNAYPDKFYFVSLTKHKDASDFLVAGDVNDLKWAALKPQRYTPDNFFTGEDAVRKAIQEENPYEYVPTGHSGLDDKMRGLVKGGITFIKAKRGMGKTELARYFETAMLKNEGTKIALLHAEEVKSITYRAMATYHLGKNVRTKDDAEENNISEKEVEEAAIEATKGDCTIIFEMRGADDPMRILEYIRLAATIYGAEFIFIDHIQRLAYLSQSGVDGATSMLTALGSRIAQLCKELNIGVVCISQVNDDGRTKYAAALEEEAIICIGLDRDVDSEDERVQNTTEFIIDKNRPFSRLGKSGKVFFNTDTTVLEELIYDA